MTYIRRAILAFALIAGIAPAFAQAPGPVPALPDAERRTTYSISGSTCACAVNFALYGDSTDYANWLTVWVNGVQVPVAQWTITSPSGSLATLPRPITDAVLTFVTAQTGTVQIVGARRPRRVSQFAENRGVAARDLNQVITDIVAMVREVWDKVNDVTGRIVRAPAGETMNPLPPAASRANMGVCFDSGGNLVPCVSVGSGTFSAGSGINFAGTNPTTISTTSVINPITSPQGRITLTSGVPVMQTSVAAATRVYYTPATGTSVPIYDGSNLNPVFFPEVFQDTTDTTKSPAAVVASSCYDLFAWVDSGTPRVTRGPPWTSSTTRSAGTALSLVNGIFLNSVSITNGPAASRGTYVGSICSNGTSTIDWIYGAIGLGGVSGNFNIWNAFNREPFVTFTGDSTANWANTTSGWRAANNSSAIRINFLRGLSIEPVNARYNAIGAPGTATNIAAAIGLDSTTVPSGSPGYIGSGFSGGSFTPQATGEYYGTPGIGQHFLSAIEYQSTATSSTWYGQASPVFQTGLLVTTWQ